jgi:hypothetical protein
METSLPMASQNKRAMGSFLQSTHGSYVSFNWR